MKNCLYCKIIKNEEPSIKVYEDKKTLAFMDLYPVSPGHVLVIPKKHFENIHDISEEYLHAVMSTVKKIVPIVEKSVKTRGVNITINNGKNAGQVIFHSHTHIIPRFPDDKLRLWSKNKTACEQREKIAKKIKNNLKKQLT